MFIRGQICDDRMKYYTPYFIHLYFPSMMLKYTSDNIAASNNIMSKSRILNLRSTLFSIMTRISPASKLDCFVSSILILAPNSASLLSFRTDKMSLPILSVSFTIDFELSRTANWFSIRCFSVWFKDQLIKFTPPFIDADLAITFNFSTMRIATSYSSLHLRKTLLYLSLREQLFSISMAFK